MRRLTILLTALLPGAALAVEVPLPSGAVLTAEDRTAIAAPVLPEGPWAGGPPPGREARGAVTRRAWRVPGAPTPDALMEGVRAALEAQGLAVVYACADRACGGYDFRFSLDLLPAPEMYVDLGDYRYLLAAGETGEGARLAAVVTSRGSGAGYVHVTAVEPAAPGAVPEPEVPMVPADADTGAPTPDPAPDPATDDFAQRLVAEGHAVLDGLAFTTGAAALAEDAYPSLRSLAAFLRDNPSARVALVGHTDAVGALDANIRLSRARAEAVRERLVGAHGADRARIDAQGAGYLAPVATNLTPEGRAANRRVEVVLLSNE
jgi:outer membrane protein OmpA-like peptidoglycan-associated protein